MEGHRRSERDPPAGLNPHRQRSDGRPTARRPRITRFLRAAWADRVAVVGRSMEPTLRPGDWLLVDSDAYLRRPPGVGELVLAPDPREAGRLLVKRVAAVGDGWLELRGDAPMASTDSRAFGPIPTASIAGRPWFRYWPPGRIGRLR